MNLVRVRRVYDDPGPDEGYRILVDRIWPRGKSKEDIDAYAWMKEVAPSTELRKWFNHDPDKWIEFRKRYFRELDNNTDTVSKLIELCGRANVTLLYSARDTEYNQAVALAEYLDKRPGSSSWNISKPIS